MRIKHTLAVLALVGFATGFGTLAHAETAGQYIDDAAITTKVKAAFMSDKQLKATDINVETSQGTVALTGSVPSKAQEQRAVHNAKQVKGVKSVTDQLQIAPTQED